MGRIKYPLRSAVHPHSCGATPQIAPRSGPMEALWKISRSAKSDLFVKELVNSARGESLGGVSTPNPTRRARDFR